MADNEVYLWEKNYTVYIWAHTGAEAEELSEAVMDVLSGLGLEIRLVEDAPEPELFRKNLTFSAIS